MTKQCINNRIKVVMVVMLLLQASIAQNRIEKNCNPSLRHRFEDCPKGYCCVRDEFLPSYVYCRKIGEEDENCTTKETDSECPCAEGLICHANIASTFVSLYGRCQNATKFETTKATTTPTTTPTITSSTLATSASTKIPLISTNSKSQSVSSDPMHKAKTTMNPIQKLTTVPVFDFPRPIVG